MLVSEKPSKSNPTHNMQIKNIINPKLIHNCNDWILTSKFMMTVRLSLQPDVGGMGKRPHITGFKISWSCSK